MNMEIVVCGSGVGRFLGSRAGSGWLIGLKDNYVLFDCGPGVPLRIADNGIDFENIKGIFVSHLHFDHIQGVGELITQYEASDKEMPPIYGPSGIKKYIDSAVKWSDFQFENRDTNPKNTVKVIEVSPGTPYNLNEYTVTPIEVPHSVRLQACSYKITDGTQTAVYSGDTPYVPDILVPFITGSNILIHEAHSLGALDLHSNQGTRERAARIQQIFPISHSTVSEAVKIAQSSGVDKLVLSHLLPTETKEMLMAEINDLKFQGEIVIPKDGLKIQI